MIPKISFIIPCRNNRKFIQLAYRSIRDLQTSHDIIFLDDASTDGTKEWIRSLDTDPNIQYFRNIGPERAGIARMFDRGVDLCKTDIFIAFHADMVVSPNFDEHILKYLEPGRVICATRVEPPLHPSGPEKITKSFGLEVEDFDFEDWYEYSSLFSRRNIDKHTEGIFAPWCMFKKDYLQVGGHDMLFAPQSKEDSDLFNRFLLSGFKFTQSWSALVYHFTCRGSRFSPDAGGEIGKDSPEWIHTTRKGMRNFIRKWGYVVQHDPLMKPIITSKYDLGLYIDMNIEEEDLKLEGVEFLEPYVNVLYVKGDDRLVEEYRKEEQPTTLYDLEKRIKTVKDLKDVKEHSILLQTDMKTLFKNPRLFSMLPMILDSQTSLEEGEFLLEEDIKVVINNRNFKQEVPIQPIFKDYL